MSELGGRAVGSLINFNFATDVNGVPTDMAGSPAISVYKTGSNVESTAGVTLTAPYDSRTGLAHVAIDTSADGTFYSYGSDYSVVITTGTLGGVSVVGRVVGHFSLGLSNSLSFQNATRGSPRGTVTAGSSTTSLPTSAFSFESVAATGIVANQFVGRNVIFDANTTTAGLAGVVSAISANTASNTPTFTVATLPASPQSGDTFTVA